MKLKITQEWLESFADDIEEPTGHKTEAEEAELEKRVKSVKSRSISRSATRSRTAVAVVGAGLATALSSRIIPSFRTESVIGKKAKPILLTRNGEVRHAFNIVSKFLLQDRIYDFAGETLNPILRNEEVTIVPVLPGAMRFYSDLAQYIYEDASEELMAVPVRSYGKGWTVRNIISHDMIVPEKIRGRTIIILDDILDSGKTVEEVSRLIQEHDPKQIITVILMRKQSAEPTLFRPDYVLFDIHPRSWVFGFGMDLEGKHRHLPYICDANQELYDSNGVPLY